ncbi:MAG: hypothetical protein NE327_14780 [Lentisphaeraceae bacterium]|nr:hypothetical protein [Lentisphaeraceae bacterium]
MKKSDKGMALITVLLTLAFMFIMVTAIVAAGELTFRMTIGSARSHKNTYLAESRMTRTMWNLVYDIKKYGSNRQLGFNDDLGSQEQMEEEVRYWADGNPHYYDSEDKKVTVVIEDANKGFDFSGNINGAKIAEIMKLLNFSDTATEEEKEPALIFIERLTDYTDRNDTFNISSTGESLEHDDYEDQFGFDLPRNAPIEFSEEVLWIPGIEDALFAQRDMVAEEYNTDNFNFNVSDYLKVVPYRGKSFPRNSKPSFFASTNFQIMHLAELEPSELDEVIDARNAWYTDGENIKDSIPELYTRLARVFSFTESKIYRIRVQVSGDDDSATVNAEAIIDLNRTLPRYSQNTFSGFRYWRKVNF